MWLLIVMTQCPSLPNQARRILEVKEVCTSFGINVLNALTYNRNVYDDSEELGSSVIEIDPEGKAAIEMIAIAEELMAMKPDNAHEFN